MSELRAWLYMIVAAAAAAAVAITYHRDGATKKEDLTARKKTSMWKSVNFWEESPKRLCGNFCRNFVAVFARLAGSSRGLVRLKEVYE